ncbi:MAG: enoyl-CoA hydratase-related protein [Thermoplasmataceae archaeon]
MDDLIVNDQERIREIGIRRSNPLNPVDVDLLEQIASLVKSGGNRAIIIHGVGKAFSAGANIQLFRDLTPAKAYDFARRGHDCMNTIASHQFPVIAAIHGYALGGGFELALSCDLRISHPDAKLGLPEIDLGILPGFGGTQRLRKLVGEARALEIIWRGKRLTADEAYKFGIVNMISEDPLGDARSVASELMKKPWNSLSMVKRLVRHAPDEYFEAEQEDFATCFKSNNVKEGVSAFLEKRAPEFNR